MITRRNIAAATLTTLQAFVTMGFEAPRSILLVEDADEPRSGERVVSDERLLHAFRNGNQEAFAILYRRHSRAVFQFAFYMAGQAEVADEMTQQVFVWLIDHAEAFDPERGSLPAFLGGVTRKFLRRQQRAERRWFPLDDALAMLHTAGFWQGASTMEAGLAAGQVREAIALLPIRYREAIVLCDLQENGYAATAQILGCSVGTVRSRLHRGRGLLAKKLKPLKRQGDPHAL